MLEVQAPRTFDLPCPCAPLQSMTTAASREYPYRGERAAILRGKATNTLDTACYVTGFGARTRGYAIRAPVAVRASPTDSRAGMLEASSVYAVPVGGRSRRPLLCTVTSDGAAREHGRNELHRNPSRSAGAVLPRHLECGRSHKPSTEATLLETHGRSSEHPRGFLRGVDVRFDPPKRTCTRTVTRGMPPTSGPPKVYRGRKTRSGDPTTSPMGFDSFRRMNPGDRCAGLPHRHHPLSEFLTLSAA